MRMNSKILNTVYAMSSEKFVPEKFWADEFLGLCTVVRCFESNIDCKAAQFTHNVKKN